MKKIFRIILRILGLLLINAGLIAFSIWLYYWPTKGILAYTESLNEVEFWTFLPFLLGFIFFFTVYKRFRYFGIGITAFCYSLTLFLFFFTNKQFAGEGTYKIVKHDHSIEKRDGYYLSLEIYGWNCLVEVSPENCIGVDSVKVRIDKGLFGMRTITQDVIIEESNNCDHVPLDSTHILRSHSLAGGELAEKRCFSGAIIHYSQCIQIDSINPYFYSQRGLMFLAIKDYENALIDFLISTSLEFNSRNTKEISKLNDIELLSITNDLKSKLERKDYKNIAKNIDNLNTIMNIKTNSVLIKVCADKLKKK